MKINYHINEGLLSELPPDKNLALSISPDINTESGTIRELEDAFGLATMLKKKYPKGIESDVYFIKEDRYLLLVIQSEDSFYKSITEMCNYIIDNNILEVHMYRVGNIHESTPWEKTEILLKQLLKDTQTVLNVYIADPQ